MASVASRLPGIRIDVAPPPPAAALPRMDVAVLVGFAATGPLHLPVVVESVRQFAAVFGPDAPLAWNVAEGQTVHAYLGPAVRAFFANGGRRCWVVRVARTAAQADAGAGAGGALALANRFAVPGVLALGADGAITAAEAQARCEGSWSDDHAVTAALLSPCFAIEGTSTASPPLGGFGFRTRYGVRAGDLVRVDDGAGSTFAVVNAVAASTQPDGGYEAEATACATFWQLGAGSPGPVGSGHARVAGYADDVPATLSSVGADGAELRFDAPIPARLPEGHWARWSDGASTVWLRMDTIESRPVSAGSPPTPEQSLVQATAIGPAWEEAPPQVPLAPGAPGRAFVLTLDLRVTDGSDVATLSGVGLTPAHPAAWWNQLSDAEFYRPPEPAPAAITNPTAPSDIERFPLARQDEPLPLAWLPLGATPLFGPALGPLPAGGTALERDGLAPFEAALFLDPELAGASVRAIPELADEIRFLRQPGRPLFGLHAAISVGVGGVFNEGTLLAVPDAIHLGWTRRPLAEVLPPHPEPEQPPAHWGTHRGPCADPALAPADGPDFGVFLDCDTRVLAPPILADVAGPVQPGAYRLTWTTSEPNGVYALVEATQPDFSDAREVYRGADAEYVALERREGVYYYQVVVYVGDERSAGSNAIAVQVRADEWVETDPALVGEEMEREWLTLHRAALRLAAAGGDLFAALALPRHFRTQQALRYAERLRAVQDPTVPLDPGAFDFTEARALSYGALYFPWLQSDARVPVAQPATLSPTQATVRVAAPAVTSPTVVPPDGAALGVLADRAWERGAWVGAANQAFADVVALTPDVPASDRLRLQDGQINLVRDEPRGFLTLSALTLALEPELRAINVRRLLTLLRRTALREGQSYVFEPLGDTLRRAVSRGFQLLLTDLFRRGAFAGATPAQGFQVVVDDSVNPPQDVEAGRLVVELRVAPSLPLTYLTVRLAQSGTRLTVTEEL